MALINFSGNVEDNSRKIGEGFVEHNRVQQVNRAQRHFNSKAYSPANANKARESNNIKDYYLKEIQLNMNKLSKLQMDILEKEKTIEKLEMDILEKEKALEKLAMDILGVGNIIIKYGINSTENRSGISFKMR